MNCAENFIGLCWNKSLTRSHINAGVFYNTSPPSPTNQNASTWGGAAGHELGVTPNRKWAELRWRTSVRWDLMSWRLLRQPLNLELIDRQFCFTPSGTERQTGGQRDGQVSVCHTQTHQTSWCFGFADGSSLTWISANVNRVVSLSRGGLWVGVGCSVAPLIHTQSQRVLGFSGQ